MATPAKLDLVRGEVTKVQFTSETHAPTGAKAGAHPRVVNKMRIFLRETVDGKERDFLFSNTTVGVHEGHVIAIARALTKGRPPILLGLINESTGQREDSEDGFEAASIVPGFFGPRWKAAGASTVIFVLGYLISRFIVSPTRGEGWWIAWPLMLAFLAYPAIWGGVSLWDRLTRGRTGLVEQTRLRGEIQALMARPFTLGPSAPSSPHAEKKG